MRAVALVLLVLALGRAPFQCASDPDPNRRLEDSAPEALWNLSEEFEARGDREARDVTLRHLVERYPRSRYARRAELVLAGEEPAANGASEPAASAPGEAPAAP
jgi:hypothetical protein